ncbi:MAG: hypothetical protein HY566_02370 [Candidatus Kerfeldbacteria bacterium]|nr:hypothetical protein [Candidatus Kerfeldbacteria bacterium]
MRTRSALVLVALASLFGTLLSGYLTWRSIWGGGCPINTKTFLTCGGVTIFGQPTCVYGFVMFLLVFLLSLFAWAKHGPKNLLSAVVTLSVVGTLFSASLSVYELWIRDVKLPSTPACVYGFFFYLIALFFSSLARRSHMEIVPITGENQGGQPRA